MSDFSKLERHERTIKVIGTNAIEKLIRSHIAVFGAGGVGGATIEVLARIGIGSLTLIDGDCLTKSNLNRQFLAITDTIGQRKVVTAKNRVHAINPDCVVQIHDVFVKPDNMHMFDFSTYDYVIDAIDNITAKLSIIEECKKIGTPLVSCMGTGNKLDSTRFQITDICKTTVCPLARVIRRELKNREIEKLNVLWSDEQPLCNSRPPGSVSFVPPVAGMMLAGYVVKELIEC